MPATFDIKSANLSVVALQLKSDDLREVAAELAREFGPQGAAPDFFDRDALVVDFGGRARIHGPSELQALSRALTACRLQPLAYRHALPEQAAVAAGLGWVLADEALPQKPAPARVPAAPQAPVEVVREIEVVREVVREVPGPSTLVLDRPLRSGQRIYARGADLLMLAMVNPGAEVAADGHIHVYAPLRGKAMAGASGNTGARIFALCMEPELVAIAGVYRTSEHALAPDVQGKAAQVRLSQDGQDKLIFEPLKT